MSVAEEDKRDMEHTATISLLSLCLSLHGITLALILSRHAHKPTLRPIGVNTLFNPHPKPLGGGRVSAGSHERDACLPSKR